MHSKIEEIGQWGKDQGEPFGLEEIRGFIDLHGFFLSLALLGEIPLCFKNLPLCTLNSSSPKGFGLNFHE
jgi:hypothetical protein